MGNCSKCGKVLNDGERFCSECGQEVEVKTDTGFEKDKIQETENIAEKKESVKEAVLGRVRKINKKIFAIAIGAVALILVAVILFTTVFTGLSTSKNDYILYIKDKEIFYSSAKNIKPMQITSNLIDEDGVDNDLFLDGGSSIISYYTEVTSSGRIFYLDKMSDSNEGATIYYRDTKKPETEPVKIDSDITLWDVNEEGTSLTYIKGEDLYQHNLTDKEKIASKVTNFIATEDGHKIAYMTQDSEVYFLKKGSEKEKIDIEISSIEYITEDFGEVYYIRENTLYKKAPGKDKIKISDEINQVLKIYDSGDVYYTKALSTDKTYLDFVVDDKKESDAALAEPIRPDYYDYYEKYWNDTYRTYDEMSNAYNLAYEEWESKYEEYSAKKSRDALRESLAELKADLFLKLCYFNGKEEKVLTEELYSDADNLFAEENVVTVYKTADVNNFSKPNLSEIDYAWEVTDAISKAFSQSIKINVACGGEASQIEESKTSNVALNEMGTKLYYMANISEENSHGDLYYVSIKGGKLGKPELYDSDVYSDYLEFVSDDDFLYYKEANEEKGDIYINKKLIDYDSEFGVYRYSEENDALVYMTDINTEKELGTLKMFKSGETVKVSDDVYAFDFTLDGKLIYLYDYNIEKCRGTLYIREKQENKKVDDDVICIVPYFSLLPYYGI